MKGQFIKNSIGLILLSFLLCATDCGGFPEYPNEIGTSKTVTYSVGNQSNEVISIKSYSQTIFVTTIELAINEKIVDKRYIHALT